MFWRKIELLPSSAKLQLNWAELALIPLSPTIHPTSNQPTNHHPDKVYFSANMYINNV